MICRGAGVASEPSSSSFVGAPPSGHRSADLQHAKEGVTGCVYPLRLNWLAIGTSHEGSKGVRVQQIMVLGKVNYSQGAVPVSRIELFEIGNIRDAAVVSELRLIYQVEKTGVIDGFG